MSKIKTYVRWSKPVEKFILDKIAEGFDVSTICKKYPTKVPSRSVIHTRSISDLEFGQKLNQAYTVLLMIRLEELHEISSMTASEAYPDLDWREAEATLKRRIDDLKFTLAKMGPSLSTKFNNVKKLEIEAKVDSGPAINIVNYYRDEPKVIATEKVIPKLALEEVDTTFEKDWEVLEVKDTVEVVNGLISEEDKDD